MADIKFSQLGAAAALTGAEIIPLVQGGVNVRATVSALGSFLGTGYVSKTATEDIGGVKTFTDISNWNLSAQGRIIYGEPGGNMTGITMYRGAWATNLARRGDIRVRATDMLLGVGAAADNAAPVNFVSVGPDFFRPTVPALWNLGTSGNAWLNTFTAELTLTGDAAALSRSRTSLGAVGTTGDETIAGIKTFSSGIRLSGTNVAEFGSGTLIAGIRGDATGNLLLGAEATGGAGAVYIRPAGVGSSANQTVFAKSGVVTFAAKSVHTLGARMGVDQTLELGGAGATLRGNGTGSLVIGSAGPSTGGLILLRPQGDQVATNQVTVYTNGAMDFSGDAASKRATCTSLNAFNLNATQTVGGLTTFSSEVRIQSAAPGFWLDESDGTNGFFAVVDSGVMQLQVRAPGFGSYVRQMLQVSASGGTFGMGGDLVRPLVDNAQALGATNYRFTQVSATNGTINTSDERLKTPLEHMTDAEESAFLEISELPMKWKWLARQEDEGDAARLHAGPGVQSAMAIMEKYELEPFNYSAFCYDSWPAQAEQWREWPAQAEEVDEWPEVPERWDDIPAVEAVWADIPEIPAVWDETPEIPAVWQDVEAVYDDTTGEEITPAHRVLVKEGTPATRTLIQEAIPARRELVREAQPARREFIHAAIPAGRVVTKEAVEAGRELVQAAVEAGDRYSFRVSELQAWILAAMARRDRRVREQVEARMTALEARLAALEAK
ncbi:tail fiber domain-containing protein [Stenotrophomonas phage A1432]|uniref:Tail fiber domain-containing protein n=1 Tax=Stenotrophomonas phage A1432 TaxID=2930315 RepID=A0A9E7N3S0_9CAUD|nr:tail fiber domain-containing protein [Stenotrophomonas phage A1432]UTC27950.1 tail fiber domain-containing protein [Stenotrophomonas phage A1432]